MRRSKKFYRTIVLDKQSVSIRFYCPQQEVTLEILRQAVPSTLRGLFNQMSITVTERFLEFVLPFAPKIGYATTRQLLERSHVYFTDIAEPLKILDERIDVLQLPVRTHHAMAVFVVQVRDLVMLHDEWFRRSRTIRYRRYVDRALAVHGLRRVRKIMFQL